MQIFKKKLIILFKKIIYLFSRHISISSIWISIPEKIKLFIKKFLKYNKFPNYSLIKKTHINKTDKKRNFHFGTIIGNHNASNLLDSSIAKYLILKGHRVSVLLCDEALPACLNSSIWKSSKKDRFKDDLTSSPKQQNLCETCYGQSLKLWENTNATIYKISELITESDLKKIILRVNSLKVLEKIYYKDIDLTEDVIAGCLRYLCKGDENIIPENLYKRYAESALKICISYEKILSKEKINVGVWVHGIYVPHGVLNKIFHKNKISFYNYNTSYREKRFYFTKNQTYHKQFPNETEDYLKLKETQKHQIIKIKEYLKSREKGLQDWQQFNNNPESSPKDKLQTLGYKFDQRELAVLYTNVVWDARLHFQENIYKDMVSWIEDTVNFFKLHSNKKLIIRIHPGELISHSVSREKVEELNCLKNLPENITLIKPQSRISSYYLASLASINIIFATKLAMELSIYDKPIICCGDAWVRGKGATIDPKSIKDYKKFLNCNWAELKHYYSSFMGLAYSYYFFERKPIYFPYFKVAADRKSFNIDLKKYELELSKSDSVLDYIENCLINENDIINKIDN